MKENNNHNGLWALWRKKLQIPPITTKMLTTLALLTACNVILNDFFALQTPLVKINFGFITIIMTAVLYGPWASVTVAMLGDVIGIMLFPPVGAPNPIFTILSGINGLIYGLCLYSAKKELSDKALLLRSGIAAFLVTQIMYSCVNSYILGYLYGEAYILGALPMRIFKNIILFFVNMMVIPVVFEVKNRLQRGNLLGSSRNTV